MLHENIHTGTWLHITTITNRSTVQTADSCDLIFHRVVIVCEMWVYVLCAFECVLMRRRWTRQCIEYYYQTGFARTTTAMLSMMSFLNYTYYTLSVRCVRVSVCVLEGGTRFARRYWLVMWAYVLYILYVAVCGRAARCCTYWCLYIYLFVSVCNRPLHFICCYDYCEKS